MFSHTQWCSDWRPRWTRTTWPLRTPCWCGRLCHQLSIRRFVWEKFKSSKLMFISLGKMMVRIPMHSPTVSHLTKITKSLKSTKSLEVERTTRGVSTRSQTVYFEVLFPFPVLRFKELGGFCGMDDWTKMRGQRASNFLDVSVKQGASSWPQTFCSQLFKHWAKHLF